MKTIQNNYMLPDGILIRNLIMARDVIDEIWCDDDGTL